MHDAVCNAQGVTGMRIWRAMVDGERDPGNWRADPLCHLAQSLQMYDAIEEQQLRRLSTGQHPASRRIGLTQAPNAGYRLSINDNC